MMDRMADVSGRRRPTLADSQPVTLVYIFSRVLQTAEQGMVSNPVDR